jgi:CPA1 family monovalent cation:H+ antiporter
MVHAISHATLLALDEVRFKKMLVRNKTLRNAVLESAARRGISLDLRAFESV